MSLAASTSAASTHASRLAHCHQRVLLPRAGFLPAGPCRGLAVAAQVASSGGGSDGRAEGAQWRPPRQRTHVTFKVPGQAPNRFERITQADLTDLLRMTGAMVLLPRAGFLPAGPCRGLAVAAQVASSGGGSDGRAEGAQWRPPRQRTHVTFKVPGQAPNRFERITQADLTDLLRMTGAMGFLTASGNISRRLEDLPEGGEVHFVMLEQAPIETQVRNLQQADANDLRGKEQQLRAFLRDAAVAEHPGSPVVVLPAEPFKGLKQQDYVQLDAAVKAGRMLYLGEQKRVVGEEGVLDVQRKVAKIRAALERGSSPDLAAALQGITHAKLFLAGEVVQAGLDEEELLDTAAAASVGVLLPSGQALGVVGAAPPARRL